MSFTGNENHDFPLNTAAEWTANYRNANPGGIQGHFFGKKAITAILGQPNVVGIRIYYALDPNGVKQLIIAGVDAQENDLYAGLIAEISYPCPPYCGTPNPLNTRV